MNRGIKRTRPGGKHRCASHLHPGGANRTGSEKHPGQELTKGKGKESMKKKIGEAGACTFTKHCKENVDKCKNMQVRTLLQLNFRKPRFNDPPVLFTNE